MKIGDKDIAQVTNWGFEIGSHTVKIPVIAGKEYGEWELDILSVEIRDGYAHFKVRDK